MTLTFASVCSEKELAKCRGEVFATRDLSTLTFIHTLLTTIRLKTSMDSTTWQNSEKESRSSPSRSDSYMVLSTTCCSCFGFKLSPAIIRSTYITNIYLFIGITVLLVSTKSMNETKGSSLGFLALCEFPKKITFFHQGVSFSVFLLKKLRLGKCVSFL